MLLYDYVKTGNECLYKNNVSKECIVDIMFDFTQAN